VIVEATEGVAVTPVAPTAAMLVDDGEAAGVRPATSTGCGVVCADGSCGASAERATADVSDGAASFFHQAQRGLD
jgi:hypothetical protein